MSGYRDRPGPSHPQWTGGRAVCAKGYVQVDSSTFHFAPRICAPGRKE